MKYNTGQVIALLHDIKDMRQAQLKYRKTHSHINLVKAQHLEKKLDKKVAHMLPAKPINPQTNLFDQ